MQWIIAIIVGGVVGWIASILMKTNAQMGIVGNVLIGIIGSAMGYWLAGLLGLAPSGGFVRFLVGITGAVLLIFILRALGVFKRPP